MGGPTTTDALSPRPVTLPGVVPDVDAVANELMAVMGPLPAALAARLLADKLAHDDVDLHAVGAALHRWLAGPDAGPLPIAELCPAIPGPLEQLVNALQATPARAAGLPSNTGTDVVGARAIVAGLVRTVDRVYPGLVAQARAAPAETKQRLLTDQASSEFARAEALFAAGKRAPACFAAARALLLVPGNAHATAWLAKACGSMFRFSPSSDAHAAELEALAGKHPERVGLHRQLVDLYRAEGYIPGAARHLKRLLMQKATDMAARDALIGLIGDVTDDWPFAAGSISTLTWPPPQTQPFSPVASIGDGALAPTPPLDSAPLPFAAPALESSGPVRGILGQLASMYGGLEPRSRLFLMVLAFGALSGGGILLALSAAKDPATEKRVQLELLVAQANDCAPGGGTLLLQAWQAARLGEPGAIEKRMEGRDASVPMGTRCHRQLMLLQGRAMENARTRGRR